MPKTEETKTPSPQSETRRPDLRGRYRDLAIPALVAACMAQKDQRSAPAMNRPESGFPPADRD